jgi:hypothetical protein
LRLFKSICGKRLAGAVAEAVSRWTSKDGTVGAEKRYDFTHDDANDGSRAVHANTKLDDPGLVGGRTWTFSQTGGSTGLVTELKRRPYGGTTATGTDSFTWVQDAAGRWYIGTSTSVMGTFTKKTAQTLDLYGNVVTTQIYNPENLASVLRTYTNEYVTDTNYTSRYIRNRLLTSTVVEGTKQAVLASNAYDQYGTWSSCWPLFSYAIGVTAVTGLRQHDAAYDANFRYRGNVTTAAAPGVCASFSVDMAGNRTGTWSKGVASTAQYQAGTNYAAPGALTVNGLSNLMQWDAALHLTQNTGANGEVSGTVYDTYGRPSWSTAATGASTGYTYSTAAPWTVTATVNGRWTKKTLDGFGRVVKQEARHGRLKTSPQRRGGR